MDRVIEATLEAVLKYDDTINATLADTFNEVSGEEGEEAPTIESVKTFDEACLMTRDRGIVLRLSDGTEFQITIKQSRSGGQR